MKNCLALLIAALCLLTACGGSGSSGSSGSDASHSLEACSFSLPASWSDNSSGDSLMYTAEDESEALNASFDDQDPEYRTALPDRLDGVDYDLDSVSVDGADVDLYLYQQDGFWYRDFEVVRDDGVYHFAYISAEKKPAHFESFTGSLRFLS